MSLCNWEPNRYVFVQSCIRPSPSRYYVSVPPLIPHTSRATQDAPRRGFALLITITLLAFLVLLLVSLASLTRVETQVAGNSQQLSQARQNALVALNIALGQLQKFAGPDQRITTAADLVADTNKAGVTAPAPLFTSTTRINVKSGARYWTGVWGNTEGNINYTLRPNQVPPTAGNRRGVTPGLLNWLISGNETAVFTTNAAGGIVAGTGLSYAPGDAINLANLAKPTIKGNPAIVLVGANTLGTGLVAEQDYVVAPLLPLTAPASAIPGADPGTSESPTPPIPVGRYAWWVGDEGVKARINLQNGYQKITDPGEQAAAQINSFITSQRSAVEFMDRDPAGTAAPVRIGTDFDFKKNTTPNIFTPPQIILSNTDATAQARLTTAAKNRFHDLGTQSSGVLSDTYAGGLKKDLSADLADTSTTFSYRPDDSTPVFTPINTSEKNLPTWGHLRAWARTNPSTSSGLVDPTTSEAKAAGVSPVILFAGMGMNYYLSDLTGTAPNQGRRLTMAFYPMVVLFNPYSWPIKATDYDVGIRFGNYSGDTGGVSPHNTFVIRTKKPADAAYTEYGYVDLNAVSIYAKSAVPTGLTNSFFRLRISRLDKGGVARDIPPGARFTYMITSPSVGEYNHAAPPELRRVNAIIDETTNYFSLTSPILPVSLNDPLDHIDLTASDGTSNNPGTNPFSLNYLETSVALADSGALANQGWPGNTSALRSAILNVFTLPYGGVGYRQFCITESDPYPEPIANRVMLESPKAKTAFRMMTVNEARFNYSTVYRAGFAQNLPTMRYIADANIRAPFVTATALENDNDNTAVGNTGTRYTARPFGSVFQGGRPDGANLDPFPGQDLKFNHYSFGFQTPANGASLRVILFDLLESRDRLLSLGQLQHVPWARYSSQTSYPFANSYAALRTPRNLTYRTASIRRPDDMMNSGASAPATDPIYDLSWLLNRALWDKYFVSGIPRTLTSVTTPLPNTRMVPRAANGAAPQLDHLRYSGTGTNQAYDKAAANLLVSGAFNINSTSKQAWRAILAGSNGLESNPAYAATTDSVGTAIPYPRFSRNLTALTTADGPFEALTTTMTMPGNTEDDIRRLMQTTNRGLYYNNTAVTENSSAQTVVAELARSIVNEIRTRGPFLSLSDFINRPLTTNGAGIKGALQAGLDNMDPAVAQVNPDSWVVNKVRGEASIFPDTHPFVTAYQWDREHFIGRTENGRGEVPRTRWAMSPIQLTQADLLSSLGPLLSARSDTFTIRTYGETLNPATGTTDGRAWCEAVVQRLPEFTGGDAAETAQASLSATSKTFGRQFKIISFRWLSPSDI